MADANARTRFVAASAAASQSTAPPPLLQSPWVRHELFAATKRAASTPDAVAAAKKTAVAKVAQELRRNRTYLDQQLRELESQLLNVTDYVNGTRTTVYTDRGLPELVESYSDVPNATGASADATGAALDSDALPTSPNTAGLRSKFVQHNFPGVNGATGTASWLANAMNTAVEDDLVADTPCTTIGLWKYVAAYDVFRDVTPADVNAALQLDDALLCIDDNVSFPGAIYKPSAAAAKVIAQHVIESDDDASRSTSSDIFLKARLVAALVPITTTSSLDALKATTTDDLEAVDADKHVDKDVEAVNVVESSIVHGKTPLKRDAIAAAATIDAKRCCWSARNVAATLRDVGLLEPRSKTSTSKNADVYQHMLRTADDDISCKVRTLQLELRDCVRQTNETKRKLRKLLQSTKPWRSTQTDAAANEAIETEFLTMWRRKREVERKQKHKDKKLLRREALPHAPGVAASASSSPAGLQQQQLP